MKYNEKTGAKEPENRRDEIQISLEQLEALRNKCVGNLDKQTENNILLKDISISLGLLVDIAASIYNRMVKRE